MYDIQPYRWTLSIKFQFSPFRILGAALIISSWKHDLSCDDPSKSRYSEPCIYTKPVAFRFLPEYNFYIISLKKFLIIICCMIFSIIRIYKLRFCKNTTPTIINIYIFCKNILNICHECFYYDVQSEDIFICVG